MDPRFSNLHFFTFTCSRLSLNDNVELFLFLSFFFYSSLYFYLSFFFYLSFDVYLFLFFYLSFFFYPSFYFYFYLIARLTKKTSSNRNSFSISLAKKIRNIITLLLIIGRIFSLIFEKITKQLPKGNNFFCNCDKSKCFSNQ